MIRQPSTGLAHAACALIISAAIVSCSLVVDVELPSTGTDADCEFLNTSRSAGVTECVRWQFSDALKACELAPLDRDDDGFHPAACREELNLADRDIDCDDSVATSYPRAEELCDSVDNDCDAKIDEGALTPRASDGATVAFGAPANQIAYAVDPVAANTIGVAYTLAVSSNVPGSVVRDRGFGAETAERFTLYTAGANASTAALADANQIRSTSNGIAALGTDQYAVAWVNASGATRRTVVGVTTKDRARTVFADVSVFNDGLPCAPGDGDCTTTPPPADRPVIGVSGADVLVAVTRDTANQEDCETNPEGVRVVGHPLRLRPYTNVRLTSGGTPAAFPVLRPAVDAQASFDIGVTRSDATPAIIGVPGVGFVTALPQTDNTLLLRTITVTAGVHAVAEARDVTLSVDDDIDPLLDPALAVGTAPSTGAPVIALAFRQGCGGVGAVRVKLFNVNADTGRITAQSGQPQRVDGTGFTTAIGERQPSIHFAADYDNTWFVAFGKQDSLRARVLASNGTPHGGGSYLLLDTPEGVATPAAFAVPPGSFGGARYGALVSAVIDGAEGLHTVHLGCFGSGN